MRGNNWSGQVSNSEGGIQVGIITQETSAKVLEDVSIVSVDYHMAGVKTDSSLWT